MLLWLQQNWGTLTVLSVLAVLIALIVFFQIRARREGKSSCGCGCGGCAMQGVCRKDNKKDNV